MFYGCRSLIFLDIRNFNINPTANYENIFGHCNQNLILCYEETINGNIKNELKTYKNNCTCSDNSYKFFKNKNSCIVDCSKDDIFKFEYNNICYKSCPERTCI